MFHSHLTVFRSGKLLGEPRPGARCASLELPRPRVAAVVEQNATGELLQLALRERSGPLEFDLYQLADGTTADTPEQGPGPPGLRAA